MSTCIKKVLLIIFIISSFSQAQNYGTWSLADSLNIPRFPAASVKLANGNILVSGGEDSINIKNAEIFSWTTKEWKEVAPMNLGRSYFKLVRLNDGRVLAVGGAFHSKSCEVYDTVSRKWVLTDSLNDARSSESVTLLDNGNVLVAGGSKLSSCEIYDASIKKWITADSLKIDRREHTAIKLLDGRVLVAGGFSDIQKELTECEIYDPTTGKWMEAAPLNLARYNHSATLLPSGKVLVTGGNNYANPQSPWLNSCELYDPVENKWSIVDSLALPRTNHSVMILRSGLLLICGGNMNNNTWELYDPINFISVHLGNYPGNQYKPLINLLPDGRVLSAGGMTVTNTGGLPVVSNTSVCYLYDPDGISGIEQTKNNITGFKLYQNYPNPFNPGTEIKYELARTLHVTIRVYNCLGKEITTLVNKTQKAGIHSVIFNSHGHASGVYIYRIITDKWSQANKMLLLK